MADTDPLAVLPITLDTLRNAMRWEPDMAEEVWMRLERDARAAGVTTHTGDAPTHDALCDCGHGSPHYARPYRAAVLAVIAEEKKR